MRGAGKLCGRRVLRRGVYSVIPAKAGTHNSEEQKIWIPAFAGKTAIGMFFSSTNNLSPHPR